MKAPTAAMIKAGADWLLDIDARDADPNYDAIAAGIWRAMEGARKAEIAQDNWSETADRIKAFRDQRWDDAVAREMVGKGRLRGTRS